MYIVIELQKNNGQIANIVTAHNDLNDAESKFHAILSAGAVSNIEIHSAVLISEEGFPMRHECYKHEAVPAVEEAEEE